MCEAVRAVSTRRFGRLIGAATSDTLTVIVRQLGLWFGLRQ